MGGLEGEVSRVEVEMRGHKGERGVCWEDEEGWKPAEKSWTDGAKSLPYKGWDTRGLSIYYFRKNGK